MEIETQIKALFEKALEDADELDELVITYLASVYEGNLYVLGSYVDTLEKIARKFPNHPEMSKFQTMLEGTQNYFSGNTKEAKRLYDSILPPHEIWKNRELEGVVHVLQGGNYLSLAEYDKAIEHLIIGKSLISPESMLSGYLMMGFYHLAEVHIAINELEYAQKILMEGLSSIEVSGAGKYRMASGLANICLKVHDIDQAKKYLDIADQYADSSWQKARSIYDYAQYYLQYGNFQKAIDLADQSYEIRMEVNLYDAANSCTIIKAKALFKLGQLEDAKKNLTEALELSLKYNSPSKERACYLTFSEIYEHEENWKGAYENFRKYQSLTANLHQIQQKEIFKMKNKEIEKQKSLVESIHKEITDSIQYAKRIQSAILPSDSFIKGHLPNSFVLYKPKDIVAGDFYWMEASKSVEQEQEKKNPVAYPDSYRDSRLNTVLIAAADCTGHGVPGAMVSVVCNNSLNRSVREFGLTDPGKILEKTRELVIQEFEKSTEDVKDGMDIALVSLEQEQEGEDSVAQNSCSKLKYAGAHNPLWIIRKGAQEIEEIKASKQPIGKYHDPQPFETHEVSLQKGDTFYIFSDGFADQFGGEKGKKFKTANLKKLFLSIQEKSMEEQKEIMDQTFEEWKGDHEQLDDVCVIGVKL